jgi:hypothetical protein
MDEKAKTCWVRHMVLGDPDTGKSDAVNDFAGQGLPHLYFATMVAPMFWDDDTCAKILKNI